MVVPCDALVSTWPAIFIVATELLLLLHVPLVEVLVKLIVDPPAQSCVLPPIAAGVAFTVAVMVVGLPQPLE